MRDYIFRGKRIDNGEWVYGNGVVVVDEDYVAIPQTKDVTSADYAIKLVKIVPETVGQLSPHELGLHEGDIVNYVTGSPSRYVNAVVEFGEYETYTHFNKEEGDVEKHFGFYINDGKAKIPLGSLWLQKIGNIHDNPELVNQPTGGALNMNIEPNVKTEEATPTQASEVEQMPAPTAGEAQESSEEGTTEG
jgi:hypothetical protein